MSSGNRKILIVEDDQMFSDFVCEVLEKLDPSINVVSVSHAGEASELLAQHTFELVISDFILDGYTSGLDLWWETKNRYPNTPFLIMSGVSQMAMYEIKKHEPHFSNLNDYPPCLTKPFHLREFQDTVKELMNRKSPPNASLVLPSK